jgi:hypothetical protein
MWLSLEYWECTRSSDKGLIISQMLFDLKNVVQDPAVVTNGKATYILTSQT